MQQDSSSALDVVLQHLLQQESCHRISRKEPLLLKLLATSNDLRAVVAAHCSGRVALTFTSIDRASDFWAWAQEREKSFTAWLVKNLHLVKELRIASTLSGFGPKLLAPALNAAAASGQAVHLASFSSDESYEDVVVVLSSLPASSLIHLGLCITHPVVNPYHARYWGPTDWKATLARFSKLQSLDLFSFCPVDVSPVLCSLSSLTSLTKLTCEGRLLEDGSVELLLQLPAQLRELVLSSCVRSAFDATLGVPTLSGGHLTALTRLHTFGDQPYRGISLTSNDVLPPKLISLCAATCDASLSPLLALQSLRKLSLAYLPDLLFRPGSLQVTERSSNMPSLADLSLTESWPAAAQLQRLQELLPGVDIRVVKSTGPGRAGGRQICVGCHCTAA